MKNRFAALLEAQYAVKGFRFATAPLKEGDGDWNKLDRSAFQYAGNNDFGAVGGISFRHKRFSALLRYQHGINLASKGVQYTNDIGEVVNLSQRNRTLMLGLGFNIL